jgi:acyl-CoA reductase-like NAD-dependent aldehyde dehydrogenase
VNALFAMTIAGRAAPTERTFDVIDPATASVFAAAPECTRTQLDEAFAAAAAAYERWRLDERERRRALREAAAAVRDAADEIGRLLTQEQGKPLVEAVGETQAMASTFEYYAELELPPEEVRPFPNAVVEVSRQPLGVVAAITPWNFPLSLASWKVAPALLAGNTVVTKPSPYTPLSTLKVGEVLRDMFPPGVLSVVTGRDELGALMTAHPIPRKITFTGSVAVGKKVALAAAPDLKRLTLELGGNDAAIVLDDADVGGIADRLFWGAFSNNGQTCCAIKRLYVPRALHDDMVDALTERARTTQVGSGLDENTQLGPLANAPQRNRVENLVNDAVTRGATAISGGQQPGGNGYWFAPTVVTGADEGTPLVDEEQFGPALPVIPYRDVEDAIAAANRTRFGLGGSVWGTDTDRLRAVAGRLQCGTSWINAHPMVTPGQPFGGVKWSGVGVENGTDGYMSFTDVKVLCQAL